MPYWVQQIEGPAAADVKRTAEQYKQGLLTQDEAHHIMFDLYRQCRGRVPYREYPQDPDEALAAIRAEWQDGADTHVGYLITQWFPLYILMVFEGTEGQCHREANRLNQMGVSKYQVEYEY